MTTRTRPRTTQQLGLETLENRELMAANAFGSLAVCDNSVPDQKIDNLQVQIGVSQRVLEIDGSRFNDYVEVSSPQANTVKVTVFSNAERSREKTSRSFSRASIDRVEFKGDLGNDYLWNGHPGSKSLRLPTGTVTVPTTVEQHNVPMKAWGDAGNDQLEGSTRGDLIIGGTGHDLLRGGSGNDVLFGGSGNDRIYGRGGSDALFGEGGRDAIFGGTGTDTLSGGSDSDRFLVETAGDSLLDKTAADTRILFEDGKGYKDTVKNVTVGNQTFEKLKIEVQGGSWSDAEIEAVDEAFQTLHDVTENVALLELSNGKEMRFGRLGAQTVRDQDNNLVSVEVGGVNHRSSNLIHITSSALTTQESLIQTVFHEVGHNWDQSKENKTVEEFRALSGWKKSLWTGFQWRHDSDAEFAREYGKTKPHEDYATCFAAYMMDQAGHTYDGLSSTAHAALMIKISDKLDVIDDLVETLS